MPEYDGTCFDPPARLARHLRQEEGRKAFNRLSEMYQARMAREGKADQTEEEIMEDLRRIREEVANELALK